MNKTTAYIIVYVFIAVHASIMLSATNGEFKIIIIIFYILFCLIMTFCIADYYEKKEEFEAKQQEAKQEQKEQKQQDQQQNGYWYRDHYGRKKWHSTEQQQTQTRTTNYALLDAYITLGVVEGESDEEIREAYKRLIKKWHPDRFVQEGEAAIHRAEEKTKAINKAYDLISQVRGMK